MYRQRSSSLASLGEASVGSESNGTSPSTPPKLRKQPSSSQSNPVIMAMIKSNTLRNCVEVQEMVKGCMDSGDKNSYMCKTAQGYFSTCRSEK